MSQMLLLDKRTQGLIEDYVPQGEILEGIVCFFSVFSDYTRVKILCALAISELCVTDLSRILGINQTTVSHQLRFLKSAFALSHSSSDTIAGMLGSGYVTHSLSSRKAVFFFR